MGVFLQYQERQITISSFTYYMFYSYTPLVGSSNGFERDFTIELTYIQGLVEDWLTCQTVFHKLYRAHKECQVSEYRHRVCRFLRVLRG